MGELRINMGSSESGESDRSTMPDELTANLRSTQQDVSDKLVGRMGDREIGSEVPSLAFHNLIDKNTGEVLGTISSIKPSENGSVYAIEYLDPMGNKARRTLTQVQFDRQVELNQNQP